MFVKIDAARWTEPIHVHCASVTIEDIGDGRVSVKIDADNPAIFTLDPNFGETVEVIR